MKYVLKFLLPKGLVDYVQQKSLGHYFSRYLLEKKFLTQNSDLKDLFKDQRLYIVCNGPSVKKQDLTLLAGQIVFTVSAGYLHTGIDKIHPKFHLIPALTFTEKFTKDKAVHWLKEMHELLPKETQIVMSVNEQKLVQDHQLFSGRKIYYVSMVKSWEQELAFNLTGRISRVQSVPIMGLLIAIYMGFKEINLVGTEHDSFQGEYKYAFNYEDHSTDVENGAVISPQSEAFQVNYLLFEQYERIASFAQKFNLKVYNLTDGGVLNVFPRKRFPNL